MMFSTPWWIYLAIAGITYSAYMVVRTAKEDKKIDDAFIEKEGEVFIERMHQEREKRLKKAEPM